MRLLLAAALLFALAAPVAAAPKQQGTCSVTPNPVAADQPLTITVTANVGFDFFLTDPTGQPHTWPQGPAGTVTYEWSTPLAGNWTVTIRNTHNPHPKVIGGCSFVVT